MVEYLITLDPGLWSMIKVINNFNANGGGVMSITKENGLIYMQMIGTDFIKMSSPIKTARV